MRNSPLSRLVTIAVLAVTLGLVPNAWGQYTESVLYDFAGGNDGSQPQGGLIADAAGNLYGATSVGDGGTACIVSTGCGVVFELTPVSGGGWQESILHGFKGGDDGDVPLDKLAIDSHGNLYGVTLFGGGSTNCGYGCGTVYELTPSGSDWTYTVIHRFTMGDDGAGPDGSLVLDSAGNLYGTAFFGGAKGGGLVFKLTPSSQGWKESVLHVFSATAGGRGPTSVLVFDAAGNLYGTTQYGGYNAPDCSGGPGCGLVFELSPTSAGPWKLSVLRRFQGGPDGGWPNGGLIFDSLGNLYGTTQLGSPITSLSDCCGVVFELTPTATGWKEIALHTFTGAEGWSPEGGLTFDSFGNLYGTTLWGGNSTCPAHGCGVIYKLAPTSDGWKFSSLHHFSGGSDGAFPWSGLLLDAAGNFYGTTNLGGGTANCPTGCGLVFELSLSADEATK